MNRYNHYAVFLSPQLMFILLGLIAFSSCKQKQALETATAFSMSDTMMKHCELYQAKNEPVRSELRLFGKIAADNNKLAQVYPVASGSVIKINVELGDYVKQGQVLAVVRSSEIAMYRKERLDAQNDVAIAEKNLQVAQDLFEGKLNSEKDLIAAKSDLEKARAELQRTREVYQIYNLKDGSDYQITAPISGFIIAKNINQNEMLRQDNSNAVFSIAEINEVWALANVNEVDIANVKIGYDAEVKTLSFPDVAYHGTVDKIFNAIDPETKAMKILVRIPNANMNLKPEMNATITIRHVEPQSMVAVPSSSIIFDKSKNWVMVFKDRSHIETRMVEIHNQVGNLAYISNGIAEGEKIISKNGLLIYDALND